MSDDSAAHDATSLAHIDIDDVNEQDEVTLSRSVDVRVSNRILAQVTNASASVPVAAVAAENVVNRPAVVSPSAAGGRVQADQEETNDTAAAAAVGGGVQANQAEADYADASAAAGDSEVLLSNDEVDDEVLRPNGAAGAAVFSNENIPTQHICSLTNSQEVKIVWDTNVSFPKYASW
jgi:hypothetical protein